MKEQERERLREAEKIVAQFVRPNPRSIKGGGTLY